MSRSWSSQSVSLTKASEDVFVHASVAQGAEVLVVGADARAKVVNDPASAGEGGASRMERCVPLNNKLWIDEHVCKHCKVWMSGHGLI